MTTQTTTPSEPLRLLFEIARDDNPRLYDELVRFKKGPKRVNRLRLLAHEGLMAQAFFDGQAHPLMNHGTGSSAAPSSDVVAAAAFHTNQAFDVPPDDLED